MAHEITIDFEGRIKNFDLDNKNALVPLFEAVVNSIQAIDDRRLEGPNLKGVINVTLKRAVTILDDEGTLPVAPICGITIQDNGVGFTEDNFKSFLTSDSQYKSKIGGKGVGRLCWLKAFDSVHVTSFYKEGTERYLRSFDFNPKNFVENDKVDGADGEELWTTIELKNLKAGYAAYVPNEVNKIALALMYHCVVYLQSDNCPIITVDDKLTNCIVNDLFNKTLKENGEIDEIKLGTGQQKISLSIHHLKLDYDSAPQGSGIHADRLILSANSRSVEEMALDKRFNGLGKLLHDKYGFCYVGIVSGSYLDKHVNMNRLSFTFPDDEENLFREVTKKEIIESAINAAKNFLGKYWEEADRDRADRIESYINNKAPQYKQLANYAKADLLEIPYNASEKEIDDAIYEAKRNLDKSLKQENAKLLKRLEDNGIVSQEDLEAYSKHLKEVSICNKTALAEYVIQRKTILDFFESGLYRNEDGKFEKEKYLHDLIFPMQASSDDVGIEDHNLWLIDERLTYCSYITSDQVLRQGNSKDRPDIMALDRPIVMSSEENTGRPFNSITIFELKRPMRDDYKDDDNPIDQLYKYAEQIRSNEAKDAHGRPINVSEDTLMYLYAVCDISITLRRILSKYNFCETPDKLGRYYYNDALKAYFEVISYNKIVNDAKMRNNIFFDKLGISH